MRLEAFDRAAAEVQLIRVSGWSYANSSWAVTLKCENAKNACKSRSAVRGFGAVGTKLGGDVQGTRGESPAVGGRTIPPRSRDGTTWVFGE